MLVGRDTECAAIERVLTTARAGSRAVLVVHGEAGIGKTVLLDHAAVRAGAMSVLRSVGVRGEADVSFAGLLELTRPIVRGLAALPAPQARALRAALALEDPPAGGLDRFAVGAGMLSLLAGVAEDGGVVVLVDDLQWVDRASAEAIVFAARRLAHDRAAFLLGVRDGEDVPVDLVGFDRLEVTGLDREGTAALAAQVHGGVLTPELTEAIFGVTNGNPLAIRELRDLDAMVLPARPAPVSHLIESTYGARAAALRPGARLALLLVAADDRLAMPTLLASLCELGIDEDALAEAQAAGLLVRIADRVAFRHPLVRSAVFQEASEADRRRVHTALADALTDDADHDLRVLHRAAAAIGTDDTLARELETIAEAAIAGHAYAAAAVAAQRAGELATSPLRPRCLLTAARARWLGGDTERAAALLEAALAEESEPELRADLERLRAEVLQQKGHLEDAIQLLIDQAREVAPIDRTRAAAMLEDAARAAMYDGRAEIAIAAADEALDIGRGSAGQPKALALVLAGRFDEALPLFEAKLAAADMDDPRIASASSDWAGWICRYGEAYRRALRAVELARAHGSPVAAAKAVQVACDQAGVAGELAASIAFGDDGIEIARETGQDLMAVWCHWSVGMAVAWRGDGDGVDRAAQGMAALGRPVSWGAIRDAAAAVRGTYLLGAGDPAGAAAVLAAAVDLDAEQVGNAPLNAGFDLVEAYFKAGRTVDSERAMARLSVRARQPWAAAALARSRGLHAGAGDGDGYFATALARSREQEAWVDLARTELLYGEWLRRRRRRIDAREHLHAALTAFERMGAAPWAALALRELAATGETHAVRRDGRPVDTLTPQEFRVASLAAEGLANRDIGQRLFLSPKTVEAHLHRAFLKLGVERRTQLAAILGDERPI